MHLPQLTTVVLLVTSGWALPQATGKTEKVPPSKANNGKAGPASWEVPATPAIVGGTLAVAGAAVYGSLRVAQWRRDQPIIKHYLSLDRRGRQMYREDYAYHLYMQNEGRDEFAMLLCLTEKMFNDEGNVRLNIPKRELKTIVETCDLETGIRAPEAQRRAADRAQAAAAERYGQHVPYPRQPTGTGTGRINRARADGRRVVVQDSDTPLRRIKRPPSGSEGRGSSATQDREDTDTDTDTNGPYYSRLDDFNPKPLLNKLVQTDWSKVQLPPMPPMRMPALKPIAIPRVI